MTPTAAAALPPLTATRARPRDACASASARAASSPATATASGVVTTSATRPAPGTAAEQLLRGRPPGARLVGFQRRRVGHRPAGTDGVHPAPAHGDLVLAQEQRRVADEGVEQQA